MNKIKIRHSIKNTFFDENLENEIFSLDFTHYQQIFETYPEIFTEAILNDIDKAEERLLISIKEFWTSCKNL